jgi:hypothetical protein
MTVIPALILILGAGYIYDNYYKPVPTEYEFMRAEEEICSVEYAIVSFGEDGSVNAERVNFVENMASFVAELKEIDCYKGIPLDSIKNLYDVKTLSGFVINYTDGSFEVITPYFCVNSDLKISKIEDLLSADLYCFDKESIFNLINKYSGTGTVV